MICVTHEDLYNTGVDGKPAVVKRYGVGIATGRQVYGIQTNGQPILDAKGNDGADTVTAVMFDTGRTETFNVADVETLTTS